MNTVLYVTNAPAPYKTGMLDAIASQVPELKVVYLANKEYMRSWSDPLGRAKHSYEIGSSVAIKIGRYETSQFLSLTPLARLIELRPSVLVIGPYAQVSSLVTGLVALLLRIPVVLWYESHRGSAMSGGAVRGTIRFLKGILFRAARAIVVPGRMSFAECLSYQIREDRIFIAPHSIDNERYARRESLGDGGGGSAPDTGGFTFLYIGQFIPRKNLALLVRAFAQEFCGTPHVKLLLVGGNAEQLGFPLPPNVSVRRFVQPDLIPDIISKANTLVLPSHTEVWGLVVNEACAAGVPVIVSLSCGSAEIVCEGVNGYVFDPHDVNDLRRKMRRVVDWFPFVDRMRIVRHITERYNFGLMASGFRAAMHMAIREDTGCYEV